MSDGDDKLVLLGVITRPRGVRGEVMVQSFCEPPRSIADFGELTNAAGVGSFQLTIRGETSKGLISRVAGVETREAAELLRQTELYIPRSRLPQPDEDEVYQDDLLGLGVVTRDGRDLGEVVAVQNFGAGDLIEVREHGGKRTEFFPFEPPFLIDVDLDARKIVLDSAVADPSDGADVPGETAQ